MVEVIGEYGQQIKPIFDIDAYGNDIDIVDVKKQKINILFPDKIVNQASREPRETKKGMKYSYRFYVQGVRITSKNIKQLLINNGFDKNPIYDTSIYDKNKVLFLPFTTKKKILMFLLVNLIIVISLIFVLLTLKKNMKIGT